MSSWWFHRKPPSAEPAPDAGYGTLFLADGSGSTVAGGLYRKDPDDTLVLIGPSGNSTIALASDLTLPSDNSWVTALTRPVAGGAVYLIFACGEGDAETNLFGPSGSEFVSPEGEAVSGPTGLTTVNSVLSLFNANHLVTSTSGTLTLRAKSSSPGEASSLLAKARLSIIRLA